MKIYWTSINEIINETDEVKTYILERPEDYSWEEGAHVHLALKGFNAGKKPNRNLIRHMSICTLPEDDVVGITTRIRQKCSEFKARLREHKVGDQVALFKTVSNIPLKRENKNVYLLSAGVGLATFRPLVLDYLRSNDGVNHIHSLNIDSSEDYLFTDIFNTDPSKNLTSQYINNRKDYYKEVINLARDKDGLFYIVGSDGFIIENINYLIEENIKPEQIVLDKHQHQLPDFLPIDLPIT